MKIKFQSDDDLPLSKILSIPVSVIIVKSLFQENERYYSQVSLKECFYEYEINMKIILMLLVNSLFLKQDFDPFLVH